MLQWFVRTALCQTPVLREPAGVLFVAPVECADQRLQPLAEGAETDDQQPRPGSAVYRGEGRDQAVNALGVDELAQVEDERAAGTEEIFQPPAGVPVVGAGVVGARDGAQVLDQVAGLPGAAEGRLQRLLLLGAPSSSAVQDF
jgi:hypothetical protein